MDPARARFELDAMVAEKALEPVAGALRRRVRLAAPSGNGADKDTQP